MTNPVKIFILNSDTDFIQKLSSNKTTNTHIIELPSDTHGNSSFQNNVSATNLVSLTDLLESHPNHNHAYKQVMDSSQCTRSKSAKITKKKDDLVCVVCGDQAFGLHYGIVTCNSCKVFFSRNAFLPSDKLHCLHGQGKCSVSHETRRKCTKYRLKRCFSMGMRTENFLTDEIKQRRRNHIDKNAHLTTVQPPSMKTIASAKSSVPYVTESPLQTLNKIDNSLMSMDNNNLTVLFDESPDSDKSKSISPHILSAKDWLAIQSIQSAYLLVFRRQFTPNSYDPSDPLAAITCWSQMKHESALDLITFFRQIDEFEALNEADRFSLIKYNFLYLLLLYKYSNYDPSMGLYSDLPNEAQKHLYQRTVNCPEANELAIKLLDLMYSFGKITRQEPTLVRLVSIMLLFSTGMLMTENKVQLNDSLAVHHAQSHYARLIWNYLIDKYDEKRAIKQFTQLMDVLSRMQMCTKQTKDFGRARFISLNIIDRISPLIQNVFDIP